MFLKYFFPVFHFSFITVRINRNLAAHLKCRGTQPRIIAVLIKNKVKAIGTGTPLPDVRGIQIFFGFLPDSESGRDELPAAGDSLMHNE